MDFLDSVVQADRLKEEAVKKENAEQLEIFRKQQDFVAQENPGTQGSREKEDRLWLSTKKRRRKEVSHYAVKLRKTSTSDGWKDSGDEEESKLVSASPDTKDSRDDAAQDKLATSRLVSQPTNLSAIAPAPSLGLEGYSSDED